MSEGQKAEDTAYAPSVGRVAVVERRDGDLVKTNTLRPSCLDGKHLRILSPPLSADLKIGNDPAWVVLVLVLALVVALLVVLVLSGRLQTSVSTNSESTSASQAQECIFSNSIYAQF